MQITFHLTRFARAWLRLTRGVLIASIRAWFEHNSPSKGAALAFYTLFSLMPILLVTIAIAGYFFGAEAARGEIIAQVQWLVGPNGAQTVQALLAAAQDPAANIVATLLASMLMLLGATTVFAELKDSLDAMWGGARPRHSVFIELIKGRLLAFGLVIFLALLLLISILLSTALKLFDTYMGGTLGSATMALAMLSSLISFCIIVFLFAVINKMLPVIRLSWRDVWIGAIFTASLFSMGNIAIGLYLSNSAVASVYGAAGSLIALLFWVYYSAQIFLLGAEFTRQYALHFGSLRHQRSHHLK